MGHADRHASGCEGAKLRIKVPASLDSPNGLNFRANLATIRCNPKSAAVAWALSIGRFAIEDNQPVAIKMILKGDFATLDDRNRFDSEALAVSQLDHPNIIPMHEIGDHEGRAFFCMKLIEGRALSERLAKGPLPHHEAADIMCQISRAIDHAHSQGILHRDLKPSNILIDKDGTAYVADFGLAKTAQTGVSLTRTGAILGTPSYMSPEQAAGARARLGWPATFIAWARFFTTC